MKRNKGFTLIELLVVIAIIGILSAIVLASLNSARTRAVAAQVQSQLSSMRAQAELYYSTTGTNQSYGPYMAKAVCTDGTATNIFGDTVAHNSLMTLLKAVYSSEGSVYTNTQCAVGNTAESAGNGTSWAAAARNPSDTANYFCVDSAGTSKESAQASGAAAVTQDATSARCS